MTQRHTSGSDTTLERELPVVDTLDAVASLQSQIGSLFLRISVGPEEDRGREARDDESQYRLPGIPVHPLRPEPWWDGGARLWVARQLVYRGERFAGRRRVHPWLATGAVVGRSAWGEPLLADWSPVATIGSRVLTQAGLAYAEWRSRATSWHTLLPEAVQSVDERITHPRADVRRYATRRTLCRSGGSFDPRNSEALPAMWRAALDDPG